MNNIRNIILFNLSLLLILCSCGEEEHSTQLQDTNLSIGWKINKVNGLGKMSRGLIEDKNILEDACSPTGGNESIGIWGDYDAVVNGVLQTSVGFFQATELQYYGISADEDSPTGWDYSGEDRFWTWGGRYKFRAYYPQKGVNVVSSSTASMFVFEWNSMLQQQDLMVAYNYIDTQRWDLKDPVPLEFDHALSALKFNFQFEEGYVADDKLTGFWLENTAEDDFASIGIMAYGAITAADAPETMTWERSYANEPGTEIYKWTYPTGIPFYRTSDNASAMATAYTTGAKDGGEYIGNDGWLLVIPQKPSGKVNICFTTEKSGTTVYRAKLPAQTETDNVFRPGYKYNYTVTIGSTDLTLDLSIAEWNRRESSHDIKFQ